MPIPSSFGRWRTSSRSTNVRTIRFDPSSVWTRRASNSSARRGSLWIWHRASRAVWTTNTKRKGVADLFMFFEPLRGWRRVWITPQRRKVEWAWCVKQLLDENYPQAERLVLVCDNLNTHTGGALYEAFPAAEARRLWERLEVHYTPKHGSWLNMAETELSDPCRPMPRPAYRRSGGVAVGSGTLGGSSKPNRGEGALAVHDGGRPDQVGETVSGVRVPRSSWTSAPDELIKNRVTAVVYV